MAEITPISDLQFAAYECELPIDVIATRIGSTPTRVREELAGTPVPDWLAPAARSLAERGLL